MRKHYFLGTAAGWSKKERVLQRKTTGESEDIRKLEEFLEEHYGGKRAIATKNGRSAIAAGLVYGLGAMEGSVKDGSKEERKEKDGDEDGENAPEVIINGFTCRAVVQGVEVAGCRPVYADIDPRTLNFTVESLEKVVTKRTRAVIIQNTLGEMVEIGEIEKFARKHRLIIMEDLAHSAGRFYPDGREAGTVGEVTILSFGKEKAVDVVGGGAVVFRKKIEMEVVRPEARPGAKEESRMRAYPTFGAIYRGLSYIGLQGVFMGVLLKMGLVEKSAEGEVDYKNETMCNFQAKLALSKLKKMQNKPIREFFLVRKREEVLEKLRRAGYYFGGFWYEKPVSPERYYKKARFPEKECPNAVFVSEHILNFPSYYSEKELGRAREIVKPYLIKEENE